MSPVVAEILEQIDRLSPIDSLIREALGYDLRRNRREIFRDVDLR
jgi:hypothetical protein